MNAYDALAPRYREIARARAAYLAGVDRLVLAEIPRGARSLLDVGAGDGERAAGIARAAGIERLVLAEPSRAMAAACRGHGEVWETAAEALPAEGGPFDVVTCLWNVLGHVEDRVEALRRMRSLLAEDGVLLLDVNHRYNARAYGWTPTIGRMLRDRVRPSERNGDVAVVWGSIRTVGHVFTRGEMARLFKDAGLEVRGIHVVDAATGEARTSAYQGHLLYVSGR